MAFPREAMAGPKRSCTICSKLVFTRSLPLKWLGKWAGGEGKTFLGSLVRRRRRARLPATPRLSPCPTNSKLHRPAQPCPACHALFCHPTHPHCTTPRLPALSLPRPSSPATALHILPHLTPSHPIPPHSLPLHLSNLILPPPILPSQPRALLNTTNHHYSLTFHKSVHHSPVTTDNRTSLPPPRHTVLQPSTSILLLPYTVLKLNKDTVEETEESR